MIQNGTGTGADRLTKSSTGELILSGSNTFTGAVTLSAGTLTVGNNAALGAGTFAFNGGTLRSDGTPRTLTNAVTLGGNVAIAGNSNLSFTGTTTATNSRTVTVNNTVNGVGSSVNWSNSFWATDQNWTVIDYSRAGSSTGVFGSVSFTTDSIGQSLASVRSGATFNVTQAGSDVILNYVAVPEPNALLLIISPAALYFLRRRRR